MCCWVPALPVGDHRASWGFWRCRYEEQRQAEKNKRFLRRRATVLVSFVLVSDVYRQQVQRRKEREKRAQV